MATPRTIPGNGFSERLERYMHLLAYDQTFDSSPNPMELVAAGALSETRQSITGAEDLLLREEDM